LLFASSEIGSQKLTAKGGWLLESGFLFPEGVDALVIFDGACVLCNRSVVATLKADKRRAIRVVSRSSVAGRTALTANGALECADGSIVVLTQRGVFTHSDALFEICRVLGFPYTLVLIGTIVPQTIRNRIYAWIARNRLRWFGQTAECALIPNELRDRLLEDT
jgi:predicted DCC family thiol-disulfide oxidoreductase YuxK